MTQPKLTKFRNWRKLPPGLQKELMDRARQCGGIRNAISEIYDLGNGFSNPTGKYQMFGTIENYGVMTDLYDEIERSIAWQQMS